MNNTNENKSITDCLIVSVDFSPYDEDVLMVSRIKNGKMNIIKNFKNKEANKLYDKLIKNNP